MSIRTGAPCAYRAPPTAYWNFAWTVLPVGVVICTAPFGSLGSATGEVPVSLFVPAGSSSRD